MGGRYYRLSTFVVAAFEISRRIVGGVFSKAQRVDRNEAKRRQKEGAAFKTQDADRARAAAALVAAGSRRAEARALAMRLEQEEEEEPSS